MAEHAQSVGTLALNRREFCAGAPCPAAAVVSLVMVLCVWLQRAFLQSSQAARSSRRRCGARSTPSRRCSARRPTCSTAACSSAAPAPPTSTTSSSRRSRSRRTHSSRPSLPTGCRLVQICYSSSILIAHTDFCSHPAPTAPDIFVLAWVALLRILKADALIIALHHQPRRPY